MNDKNNALFFNEDNDFNAVITLTDEDGNDMDMEAVAALEIHELGKEYIAVVPTEPNDEFEDGEVLLLIYSEDADGNPVFDFFNAPISYIQQPIETLVQKALGILIDNISGGNTVQSVLAEGEFVEIAP